MGEKLHLQLQCLKVELSAAIANDLALKNISQKSKQLTSARMVLQKRICVCVCQKAKAKQVSCFENNKEMGSLLFFQIKDKKGVNIIWSFNDTSGNIVREHEDILEVFKEFYSTL